MTKSIAGCLLVVLLFSCVEQEVPSPQPVLPVKSYDNVDEPLWVYFQRFEEAAARFNLQVDLEDIGIQASIAPTPYAGVVGLCNHRDDQPNSILIGREFFDRSSDLHRELIVFHELGHCVLERSHDDGLLHNGRCKSIMRTGDGSCIDAYDEDHRDYYIEELFEEF